MTTKLVITWIGIFVLMGTLILIVLNIDFQNETHAILAGLGSVVGPAFLGMAND